MLPLFLKSTSVTRPRHSPRTIELDDAGEVKNMFANTCIALESGVDESVRGKFPGADVTYGSSASGASDNREIPLSEGGDINPRTGK